MDLAKERKRLRKIQNQKETKKEEREYKLYRYAFIACGILFLAHIRFQPLTVGYNIWYIILVYILPFIFCSAYLYYKREHFLNSKRKKVKKVWKLILLNIVYLWISFLISLLSIGLLANISFTIANYYTAKNNPQQRLFVEVEEFHLKSGSKSSSKIYYYFNGKEEFIRVSDSDIKHYISESGKNSHLELKLRKGLLGHYLIESYKVIP